MVYSLVVRGYLALAELASPPVHSRHLVLPATDPAAQPQDSTDDSKTANLCVFLHGALKVGKRASV